MKIFIIIFIIFIIRGFLMERSRIDPKILWVGMGGGGVWDHVFVLLKY